MLKRTMMLFFLFSLLAGSARLRADDQQDLGQTPGDEVDVMTVEGGFAKPYSYERQAYGYDPEGIEYKENQAEDFQVIFITSAPFTAGASFLLTSLASLATRNSFDVGGDYFWPFIGGAFLGATTIACVSTLTNKYPPPPASSEYSMAPTVKSARGFQVPVLSARF